MNDPVITLSSAFIIGLLGGVHCIGMCGGIVNALSFAASGKNDNTVDNKPFFSLLFYNLGRIFSYTLAGALVGGLGMLLQGPMGVLGPGLRIFAGFMMIAMGLYLAGWWRGLVHLENFGNRVVWRHLQPLTKRWVPVTRPWQALLLGMLWGWLPCGLVYSTLTLAGALGNWNQAALVMSSFGLGTLPVMFLSGAFASRFKQWIQHAAIRSAAALMVMGFGLWTLASPLLHMFGRHSH